MRNGTAYVNADYFLALIEIVAAAALQNSPEELVAAAHALHDELRARRRPGDPARPLRRQRLFIARVIVSLAYCKFNFFNLRFSVSPLCFYSPPPSYPLSLSLSASPLTPPTTGQPPDSECLRRGAGGGRLADDEGGAWEDACAGGR